MDFCEWQSFGLMTKLSSLSLTRVGPLVADYRAGFFPYIRESSSHGQESGTTHRTPAYSPLKPLSLSRLLVISLWRPNEPPKLVLHSAFRWKSSCSLSLSLGDSFASSLFFVFFLFNFLETFLSFFLFYFSLYIRTSSGW